MTDAQAQQVIERLLTTPDSLGDIAYHLELPAEDAETAVRLSLRYGAAMLSLATVTLAICYHLPVADIRTWLVVQARLTLTRPDIGPRADVDDAQDTQDEEGFDVTG